MKKISHVPVIDSLAEITRHHDREQLERSLASTLAELIPSREFRLYKVLASEPAIEIALLIMVHKGVVISDPMPGRHKVSSRLTPAISQTVYTSDVTQVDDEHNRVQHLVYPVFGWHKEVHAVLVQTTDNPHVEDQRFIHGLLRVYSNYLMLPEENQRDKLTRLPNRETLDREITRLLMTQANMRRRLEHAPATRRLDDESEYWLCVLDLDHFQRINEKFAHRCGDEVLILLARLLESTFRDSDQVYRYGGEKFIIIFRTNGQQDAAIICERLRTTVEDQHFPQVGHITASIGVVQILDQENTSGVIDQADEALHYAKEHEHNQVCFFQALMDIGLATDAAEKNAGGVTLL